MKKLITLSLATLLTVAVMAQVSSKVKENKSRSQQKWEQIHSQKHNAKASFNTTLTTLKSVESDKHVLDSIVWWELNSETNEYYMDWKDAFVYNENGLPILEKYYLLADNNIVLFAFDSIYYNASNQIAEAIDYYDETESGQTPTKYHRAIFLYNENNKISQESGFIWDSESNLWVEIWKTEYQYNANGLIETKLEYSLNEETNELELVFKIEESYNAQNLLAQSIGSYWNTDQSNWETSGKTTFEYNDSNKLIVSQEFYWESNDSQWINSSKNEYSYDANNNMTAEIDFYWDDANSAFVANYKSEYVFDTNNNLIDEISYDWNTETSNWLEYAKETYSYDNTVPYAELTLPFVGEDDISLYFNHKLLCGASYLWNSQNNNWDENEKSEYYYTVPGGGTYITNNFMRKIALFPNPATNSFTLSECGLVKIYDNTGRLLISQNTIANQTIDISNLANGSYVAIISGDRKASSVKFVKN